MIKLQKYCKENNMSYEEYKRIKKYTETVASEILKFAFGCANVAYSRKYLNEMLKKFEKNCYYSYLYYLVRKEIELVD